MDLVNRIFQFIIIQLPNLVIDFVDILFTPLKEFTGVSIYNAFKTFYFATNAINPLAYFFWDNFYEPIWSFGVLSIFSVFGFGIILILKIIDLFIPI